MLLTIEVALRRRADREPTVAEAQVRSRGPLWNLLAGHIEQATLKLRKQLTAFSR